MASSFNTNQISVGAVATLIVAQNTGRKTVVITNLGTTAVYLGANSGVTSSTGQILPGVVGASISIPQTGPVWGITAGGSQSVSFLDV
jgi:hypothetical protein